MDRTIARLEAVSKCYGDALALDNVDLTVRQGEVLAVLGPNGAGKTTAVRVMMGLVAADSGVVTLFDQPPTARSARSRTGVMLQLSGVPDTLTPREVIRMFRHYYSNPMDTEDLIEAAGIGGIADRRLGKLSGGQRQRVLFALAICGTPDLVFLDEPTVGLDVRSRRNFWHLIRTLSYRGCGVVLTTHYLEEADALADRIIVLNRGRVIADGGSDAIKSLVPARRIRCRTRIPLQAVRGLAGVVDVTEDGSWIEIATPAAESVVRELLARDPELQGLEITGARLEDAFVALTEERRQVA